MLLQWFNRFIWQYYNFNFCILDFSEEWIYGFNRNISTVCRSINFRIIIGIIDDFKLKNYSKDSCRQTTYPINAILQSHLRLSVPPLTKKYIFSPIISITHLVNYTDPYRQSKQYPQYFLIRLTHPLIQNNPRKSCFVDINSDKIK